MKHLAAWLLIAISMISSTTQAQTPFNFSGGRNLVAGEYFFDEDPGDGNGTPLPLTDGLTSGKLEFSPDLSGLEAGQHQLFVRLKNEKEEWTIVRQHDFVMIPEATNRAPGIASVAYSFGNSKTRRSLPIPTTEEEPWMTNWELETGALEPGEHRATFHLIDSKGVAGVPHTLTFQVLENHSVNTLSWSIQSGERLVDEGNIQWENQTSGESTLSWLIDPIGDATAEPFELRVGLSDSTSSATKSLAIPLRVEPSLYLQQLALKIEGPDLILHFGSPLRRKSVLELSIGLQEWSEVLGLDPGTQSTRIPVTEEKQFFRVRQILE